MDEAETAALRESLVHQLGHIIDELEATKVVAGRLTPEELESRFMGPSVKECYGAMTDWDRTVILPLLRRMQEEAAPASPGTLPQDNTWNEADFGHILQEAQHARQALVDYVTTLPHVAWMRTGTLDGQTHDVFGLLHALTQHDVRLLQRVARQLQRSL